MAAKLGAHEIVENIIQLALEKQNNDTTVSETFLTHQRQSNLFIELNNNLFRYSKVLLSHQMN